MDLTQNKIESTKVVEIVQDYKSKSNKDLMFAMDFINKDFEVTKETLIKLTNHLDKLETTYNVLLKEYQSINEFK